MLFCGVLEPQFFQIGVKMEVWQPNPEAGSEPWHWFWALQMCNKACLQHPAVWSKLGEGGKEQACERSGDGVSIWCYIMHHPPVRSSPEQASSILCLLKHDAVLRATIALWLAEGSKSSFPSS